MPQEVWTPEQYRAYCRQAGQRGGRGGAAVPAAEPLAVSRPGGGRVRHVTGEMNRLEAAYEAQQLRPRLLAGEVVEILFEKVKLKLADRTYYTPDFFVVLANGGAEVHEVKGFWEDDARVKWKACAENFWWWAFFAATRQGRRGPWVVERYRGGGRAS